MLAGPVASSLIAAPYVNAGLPDVCGTLADQTERAEGIPEGLVRAVALTESGRWLPADRLTRAWPWTVTSGPQTFYLATKSEALRKVEELRASGRSNIDVGCMQVNLGYHGHAFASLDEALEPASNIAYGAKFLKHLRLTTRSWARATARYHSSDPDRGQAYRDKVYRRWQELRHDRITRPVRIVGATAGREPSTAGALPSRRHLILPMLGPKPAQPGSIAIVRGQWTRRRAAPPSDPE